MKQPKDGLDRSQSLFYFVPQEKNITRNQPVFSQDSRSFMSFTSWAWHLHNLFFLPIPSMLINKLFITHIRVFFYEPCMSQHINLCLHTIANLDISIIFSFRKRISQSTRMDSPWWPLSFFSLVISNCCCIALYSFFSTTLPAKVWHFLKYWLTEYLDHSLIQRNLFTFFETTLVLILTSVADLSVKDDHLTFPTFNQIYF